MPWMKSCEAAAAGKLLACYEDPKEEDCGRLLASLQQAEKKKS